MVDMDETGTLYGEADTGEVYEGMSAVNDDDDNERDYQGELAAALSAVDLTAPRNELVVALVALDRKIHEWLLGPPSSGDAAVPVGTEEATVETPEEAAERRLFNECERAETAAIDKHMAEMARRRQHYKASGNAKGAET